MSTEHVTAEELRHSLKSFADYYLRNTWGRKLTAHEAALMENTARRARKSEQFNLDIPPRMAKPPLMIKRKE